MLEQGQQLATREKCQYIRIGKKCQLSKVVARKLRKHSLSCLLFTIKVNSASERDIDNI